MKIKRLEIIGFKSFVDKVSLDFPEGITAVVGPNGCGKSNIVDAIRWVMGEQSAKNLRGRSMEDVIFGGCESRKALGMAEVTLVFSADDRSVPAKYLAFSEIQVTRRLYRDGESEYLLNKTPCRLMDIAELFMDTGVGARAYSIIEQGRIGMILLAKPEDRRFLIEEAAGVTKYKARKQVALKKIDLSRQNLLRIGDIISELKRQLNSLQRQAKKAERFRTYREELKQIEIAFAVKNHASLSADKERITHILADLEKKVVVLHADLEKGDLALEEKRIALLEQEKALSAAQENLFSGKAEIQAAQNLLEMREKELANLQRQKERLSEELANLRKQLAEAEAERKSLEERRDCLVVDISEEEQSLAVREQELADLTDAEHRLAAHLDETRRELFSLLSEITHHKNQEAAAVKRLGAIKERFERNRTEFETFQAKIDEITSRSAALQHCQESLAGQKTELEEALADARHLDVELKARLDANEGELAFLRDDLSKKRSRLHSLQELEAQFAGYGQGVRSILLSERFKTSFSGVVADIVGTEEFYELALEAVLGEKLQYVMCSSTDDAIAAIDFLKESAGGRCTFVPSKLGEVSSPHRLPEGRLLLDHVAVADGYEGTVGALLAKIYVVDNVHTALDLSGQHPGCTFVTVQGEVASSGGVIYGGSTEGARQGLVHKKREIKELDRQVAMISDKVLEKERSRQQIKEEIVAVEENLRSMRQKLHSLEIQMVNCDKDLQRAREENRSMQERISLKQLEDDQLLEEETALKIEIDNSCRKSSLGDERKAGVESEIARLQELLAGQKRQISEVREVVTGMKVRVAELKERGESNLSAIRRLDASIANVSQRIDRHLTDLRKSDQEREFLDNGLSGELETLLLLQKKQLEREETFAVAKQRYEEEALIVKNEETRLRGLRAQADQMRDEMSQRSLQHSELNSQLQILENSLMDRYRLEISSLVPEWRGRECPEDERRVRQAELQILLDEIGEVNLTAIDEYRELEDRFNFLSSQKGDLEESLHSLQKAIQRINKTTRKRFLETFHQVNGKFQEVFPRLFCGGRAELRLTNEEDLLETGIEIVVQPPGKKLQNVTLLSGGEKALTAVALIFSIFLIKPSPFCLLDEVDAPLDDANIGRFNDMIREMTSFSQFIVITHNKATMAVADTLFGVTMEEPGVSRLVSVRLN